MFTKERISTLNSFLLFSFSILSIQQVCSQPPGFAHTPTFQSGVLLGQVELEEAVVAEGSWVAAFDSDGNCAGAAEVIFFGGIAYVNLTIFGDDPATEMIDEGLTQNDVFILQLYDPVSDQYLVYTENGEPVSLTGWTNNNGAPMPGYDDPSRVFQFLFSATIFQAVSASPIPPTCADTADGSIELVVEGAFPPFSFEWSTGADGALLSDLEAGSYTCTVTDLFGQSFTAGPFSLEAPPPILIVLEDGIDTCNIGNGKLIATVDGGIPPFAYAWSNGANTPIITDLSAGVYQIEVTDVNGCSRADEAEIDSAPEPDFSFVLDSISCFGDSDGGISIEASGGTLPFSWLWSNGATSNTIANLSAGTYSVTAVDGFGCARMQQVELDQPDSIAVAFDVVSSSTSDEGYFKGNVFAEVMGGTPPYIFQWDDPAMQTTLNLAEVVAGDYTLTLMDASGCTYVETVNVPIYLDAMSLSRADYKGVLFPNPSSGNRLFLAFDEAPPDFETVRLYSVSGRVAGDFKVSRTNRTYQVELGLLPSGIYRVYIPALNVILPELWIFQE